MSEEKQEKLTQMVDGFCDEYLNDEYKQISHEIIEEMANGKSVFFERGKLEVWASAVIYAVCQIYSLFDESGEVHIARKDIFRYFKTNQALVLKKAVNLRNVYHLDKKYGPDSADDSADDFEDDESDEMTVEDYQEIIDDYEKKFGKRFFKENEGYFWLIHETRPYMQCLMDQAFLLWENGEKEKAVDQYKYMLKLNPNDNQGVRDILFPNLLELNRLDEARELYWEYDEDCSSSWKFSKLLLDIKSDASFGEIEMEYKDCIKSNPYIVPFLLGDKKLPSNMPFFYGIGDENEAVFYVMLSQDAWHSDKNAMKVLRKLSKK